MLRRCNLSHLLCLGHGGISPVICGHAVPHGHQSPVSPYLQVKKCIPCSVLSSRVPCFVRILCGYPDRQHKYWIIKQPRTANILTSPAAPNIAGLKQRACTKYVRRYSEVVVRLLSKFKKLLSRLVCFRYHVTSGILEIKRFNFYFLDLTGKYSDCIWYTDSQRAHNILPGWSDWRFT